MSGHYPPSGHSHNLPPHYYTIDPSSLPSDHVYHAPPPSLVPDGHYPPSLPENPFHAAAPPPSFVQYADPLGPPSYVDHYEDASGPMDSAPPGSVRARRRLDSGEHVKHRRTRSGCFTCRQRRVKCDENHPICERCRKANRECKYPESPSGQSGQSGPRVARSGTKAGKNGSAEDASSPEDQEEDGGERLPPIFDDEEYDEDEIEFNDDSASRGPDVRDSSHTPRSILDQSTSPSTEASSTGPPAMHPSLSRKGSAQAFRASPISKGSSSAMARDLQFYLNYFQTHMTAHHYSLKRDTDNFLKGDFLSRAIKFEPLKYAVAGFAAYFHTLSLPDGRMSTFLQFYNESVSRLRISITKNKKQGLSTFLTILQLASIEEMLGDWVNLMGHQKAAFEMLTRLYTPQSITESDFLLKVFSWYIRFDLMVGFQSGGEAVLGREWYVAVHERYAQKVAENPEDVGMQYEERFAYSRTVAKDSNDLFARTGKGLVSPQDFMQQLPRLKEQVEGLQTTVFPKLLDPSYKVSCIPESAEPSDIVDAYEPNIIWKGPLWTSNYLCLDTWGIIFMFNISVSMALKQPLDPALAKSAYRIIQIFEAMRTYPDAPPGTILEAQVCFAIATLFLPKDAKTVSWCRKRFANIEAAGYIYSDVLRNRMLESMGVGPSDWWLPDDEACPPIIRSIKDFIKDRTLAPRDQVSDDLREMRGIFNTMTISDSPQSDTMTVTSADSLGNTSVVQGNEQYDAPGPERGIDERKLSNAEAHGRGLQ